MGYTSFAGLFGTAGAIMYSVINNTKQLYSTLPVGVQRVVECVYKWCKIPYELALTYVSIVESYADEWKIDHRGAEAGWYWYPWFCVASVYYIALRMVGYMYERAKEHFRDKTLRDAVKRVNENTIELTYEWKKQTYVIRLGIDKMQMRQFKRAVAIVQHKDVETEVDVSEPIRELLGPLENWHHHSYTVEMFGWKKLVLHMFNTEEFESYTIEYSVDQIFKPVLQPSTTE